MELFIQYNELFEILIIRSFKDNDVNKYTLEKSIYHFFVDIGIQHIHYMIKDVSTCESLVDVLRKYSNVKIVIFDCHGHQTKKDVFGGLVIGNELFNIWEYVQKSEYFPVPPIVMFSACNTYPLGNTFNSIANGFLAAGLVWSLCISDPQWNLYVRFFFLGCVAVAGIYGGISTSGKIFFAQAMPAIIAICVSLPF